MLCINPQGATMRQVSMEQILNLLDSGSQAGPKKDHQQCCPNDGYQSEVSSNASSVGSESSSGWNNSRMVANTSGK